MNAQDAKAYVMETCYPNYAVGDVFVFTVSPAGWWVVSQIIENFTSQGGRSDDGYVHLIKNHETLALRMREWHEALRTGMAQRIHRDEIQKWPNHQFMSVFTNALAYHARIFD